MTTYVAEARLPASVDKVLYDRAKQGLKIDLGRQLAKLLAPGQAVTLEIAEKEEQQTYKPFPDSFLVDRCLVLQLIVDVIPVVDIKRPAIYRDKTPDYMKWNEELNTQIMKGLDIPTHVIQPPSHPNCRCTFLPPKTLWQRFSSWWKEMQKPMPYDGGYS